MEQVSKVDYPLRDGSPEHVSSIKTLFIRNGYEYRPGIISVTLFVQRTRPISDVLF